MGTASIDEALEAFLRDTLSPDPDVQRRNSQVLDGWVRSPSPQIVAKCLAVLVDSDAGRPTAIRQASASLLKQLLKTPSNALLQVSETDACGSGASVVGVLHTHLPSLLAASSAGPPVLQTAIASLITTMLRTTVALGQDAATHGMAGELWTITLQSVHTRVRESLAQLSSSASTSEAAEGQLAGAATLLQLLCEDCGKELREFLGANDALPGGAPCHSRSLALCEVFEGLLAAGEHALRRAIVHAGTAAPPPAPAALNLCGLPATLTSLRVCFDEDVLPAEHPFDDEDMDGLCRPGSTAQEEGEARPAMDALRAVMARSAGLHIHVTQLAVRLVFPWLMSSHVSEAERDGPGLSLASALFEYMSQMVAASGREVRDANAAFLSASLPVILALWPHATESEASAGPLADAVRSSLAYLSSVALLGPSPTLSQSLPRILDAVLPLCALPVTAVPTESLRTRERDTGIADDPRSVRVVLHVRGHLGSAGDSDTASDAAEGARPLVCDDGDDREATGDRVEDDQGWRGLVSTLLNNISTAYGDDGHLVAYLFPPTLAILQAHSRPADDTTPQPDPRVAEAALFVLNEVVEGCLSSPQVTPPQVAHIAQVAAALAQLLSGYPANVDRAPFFVRAQAILFLGRATATVIESLLHRCPSPVAGLFHSIPLDATLALLASHVRAEGSKLVQRHCIGALTVVVTACLRPTVDSLELDTDSDDDDDDGGGDCDGVEGGESVEALAHGRVAGLTSARAFSQHLLTVVFAANDSPIHRVIAELMGVLPHLQLGPRTAVYDFLGRVIPRLADRKVPLHAQVVTSVLEGLASQCAQTIPQSHGGHFPAEAAYLLVTISQVVMGAGELVAPAVPHFTGLARYVMSLCQPSGPADNGAAAAALDGGLGAEDMCELAMDLLSSLCDAMIDRDALLPSTLRARQDSSGADVCLGDEYRRAAERLAIVQGAFSPSPGPSVLAMCAAVLSRDRMAGGTPDSAAGSGLHRACLGLVYDCVMACPSNEREAVFWPLMELTLAVELRAFTGASSVAEALKAVADNDAMSNAFLCLGELTFLHLNVDGPAGSPGFVSTLEQATPALQGVVTTLAAVLGAKPAETVALARGVRLNMVNALTGLTAFLAVYGVLGSSQQAAGERAGLVIRLAANQLRHFAHFDEDGSYECVQVLTGLAHLLARLPEMCTHTALEEVLRTQKSLATATVKAMLVASKCAAHLPSPRVAATVLGDWVAIARAITSAGSALTLTGEEKRAARALSSLPTTT